MTQVDRCNVSHVWAPGAPQDERLILVFEASAQLRRPKCQDFWCVSPLLPANIFAKSGHTDKKKDTRARTKTSGCGSKPCTLGEHQNRWYMGVHPPQNGIGIGYDPPNHAATTNPRNCSSSASARGLRALLRPSRLRVFASPRRRRPSAPAEAGHYAAGLREGRRFGGGEAEA